MISVSDQRVFISERLSCSSVLSSDAQKWSQFYFPQSSFCYVQLMLILWRKIIIIYPPRHTHKRRTSTLWRRESRRHAEPLCTACGWKPEQSVSPSYNKRTPSYAQSPSRSPPAGHGLLLLGSGQEDGGGDCDATWGLPRSDNMLLLLHPELPLEFAI